MTIAQQMRLRGLLTQFSNGLRARDCIADTGELVRLIVNDAPQVPDPNDTARAELPVYVTVMALSADASNQLSAQGIEIETVADPRAVQTFTECENAHRVYTIQRYLETSGNILIWKWECEAQRQ